MIKNNKISKALVLAAVLLTVVSCKRELDVAPPVTYNGTATHTIAELLEYHPLTTGFTYDSLPAGIVIQGVIISSDQEGNCYKYISIDDGTAAVQIKINSSDLYINYPLGQRVFVECDGLVLGDYGLLHQLGWWENESMQSINTNVLGRYLYKDNLPGANPEPCCEISSAYQIQNSMYGRLVRLKNCRFQNPGQTFADNTTSGTSRIILFEDGSEITLYTSRYATFANQLTPDGTFDMVVILSRFRSTNQVVLRFISDIEKHAQVVEQSVFSMDLSQNPLDNGWTNQVVAGNSWNYQSTSSVGNIMYISGTNSANDSWLISPAISNLSAYQNMKLSFSHTPIGTTNNREVYYSTTYTGGTIDMSQWTKLDVPYLSEGSVTPITSQIELPYSAYTNPNFRIAFRYSDNQNTRWILSRVELKTIVEQ